MKTYWFFSFKFTIFPNRFISSPIYNIRIWIVLKTPKNLHINRAKKIYLILCQNVCVVRHSFRKKCLCQDKSRAACCSPVRIYTWTRRPRCLFYKNVRYHDIGLQRKRRKKFKFRIVIYFLLRRYTRQNNVFSVSISVPPPPGWRAQKRCFRLMMAICTKIVWAFWKR